MNHWNGLGRLVRDPDVRYTQGDKPMCIARFTLAVDRRFKRQGGQNADFIPCVCFGKTGEFVEKYCHKGTKIAASGSVQTGSYTNRDGQKVYTTEIALDDVEFAESKAASQNAEQTTQQTSTQQTAPNAQTGAGIDNYMNIPDGIDSEMPFC